MSTGRTCSGKSIDGSLRPANQLAIVPNATHMTLAIDPMLPEIVGRLLGTEWKAVGRGEARALMDRP